MQQVQKPEIHVICGARRSGTTLLAAILSSDPRANPLGQEAQILTRILESYGWCKRNFEGLCSSFFDNPLSLRDFYRETLDSLTTRMAQYCAQGVLVLKNPELSLVIDELCEILPSAHIIGTVRDPRDQIASELEVGRNRVSDGIEDNAFETRNIDIYIKNYMKYVIPIIRRLKEDVGNTPLVIRYEDLVQDTKRTIAMLEQRMNLSLSFNPDDRWRNVSPLAALQERPCRSPLYGAPVSSVSVGRFRKDLSKPEVRKIEKACEDVMDFFGYCR